MGIKATANISSEERTLLNAIVKKLKYCPMESLAMVVIDPGKMVAQFLRFEESGAFIKWCMKLEREKAMWAPVSDEINVVACRKKTATPPIPQKSQKKSKK